MQQKVAETKASIKAAVVDTVAQQITGETGTANYQKVSQDLQRQSFGVLSAALLTGAVSSGHGDLKAAQADPVGGLVGVAGSLGQAALSLAQLAAPGVAQINQVLPLNAAWWKVLGAVSGRDVDKSRAVRFGREWADVSMGVTNAIFIPAAAYEAVQAAPQLARVGLSALQGTLESVSSAASRAWDTIPTLDSSVDEALSQVENTQITNQANPLGKGGDYWKVQNEVADPTVPQQFNDNACVSACAEYLARAKGIRLSQETAAAELGTPATFAPARGLSASSGKWLNQTDLRQWLVLRQLWCKKVEKQGVMR